MWSSVEHSLRLLHSRLLNASWWICSCLLFRWWIEPQLSVTSDWTVWIQTSSSTLNSFLWWRIWFTNGKLNGKLLIVLRESKISLSYPRLYHNQTSNWFIEGARAVLVCIGIAIFCIVSYTNTIPSLIAREKKIDRDFKEPNWAGKVNMNLPNSFLFIQIFKLDSTFL